MTKSQHEEKQLTAAERLNHGLKDVIKDIETMVVPKAGLEADPLGSLNKCDTGEGGLRLGCV